MRVIEEDISVILYRPPLIMADPLASVPRKSISIEIDYLFYLRPIRLVSDVEKKCFFPTIMCQLFGCGNPPLALTLSVIGHS